MYNKARAQMLTHYRYCTTEQNERKMGPTATHADCYTTDGAMMTVGFTTGLTRRPKAPQPYRHSHPSCMRKPPHAAPPSAHRSAGQRVLWTPSIRQISRHSETSPRVQSQRHLEVPLLRSKVVTALRGYLPRDPSLPFSSTIEYNTDSAGASRGAIALTPQGLSLAAFL